MNASGERDGVSLPVRIDTFPDSVRPFVNNAGKHHPAYAGLSPGELVARL